MSLLNPHPDPVKLVVNAFYREEAALKEAVGRLSRRYGAVEARLEPQPFAQTGYYRAEMGEGLKKTLIAFETPLARDGLVEAKLLTCGIESMLARRTEVDPSLTFPGAGREFSPHSGGSQRGVRRLVNLDPGALYPEKFVLATGKNFPQRLYLGQGVYAELTLIYRHERFEFLPWTYPDYQTQPVLDFLAAARRRLLGQLRERRGGEGP